MRQTKENVVVHSEKVDVDGDGLMNGEGGN